MGVKTDYRLVHEIHKHAARSGIKNFRTTTFIPKIARNRKAKVDGLLMGYKKDNQHFCYIVRNGDKDIRVLIKRISEGERCPYRELSLDVLGRLSPLKTQIREPPKEKLDDENEDDGFTTQEAPKERKNY